MPALYGEVRSLLKDLVPSGSQLLDVGGRKSWYTVGLPVSVTIADLPRESEIQHSLNLGMTDSIDEHVTKNRSNIAGIVLDDMSQTKLEPSSFDAIVSVEVIEHVDDDAAFVANLANVVRPGGAVILTTPNGDRSPIPVGDHRRHYKKDQLEDLLRGSFDQVVVEYGVAATKQRLDGLKSFNPRDPKGSIKVAASNIVNRHQSGRSSYRYLPYNTAHLYAVAIKTSAQMVGD